MFKPPFIHEIQAVQLYGKVLKNEDAELNYEGARPYSARATPVYARHTRYDVVLLVALANSIASYLRVTCFLLLLIAAMLAWLLFRDFLT